MTAVSEIIDPPTETLGPPAAAGHHASGVIAPSSTMSEEDLNRGIIRTEVSRALAAAITIFFFALIFTVPLAQMGMEWKRGQQIQVLELFHHRPTAENNRAFEKDVEKASVPRTGVQPAMQWTITRIGGFGNSQGVVGVDGWLFYQPGLDYLMGPGVLDPGNMAVKRKDATGKGTAIPYPDPRAAILKFDAACRRAGARLVLVPVPDKAMLQPAQLTRRLKFNGPVAPPNNPDYARLIAELRAAGIDIFDPTPAVIYPEDRRFLVQDTHWTPQWMQQVAEGLAAHLNSIAALGPAFPRPLVATEQQVRRVGDLVDMLNLPANQTIYPPQEITIRIIEVRKGEPWQPRHDAPVLLLGDSFTNIYSMEAMGWGESAGFAEQLSYCLQRPVDRISRNGAGAHAIRQALSTEMARGHDRLAGKKIVVWEFAIRNFQTGDWEPMEMKLGTPPPSRFIVPKPGEELMVTGTIEAISLPPRPGSVPYKDHIIALHLVDLAGNDPRLAGGQALVYLWSMRNNVWTAAARYRPDQKITIRLRPWSDVSGKLEAINRRDLDDEAVNLEEPCWGEEIR